MAMSSVLTPRNTVPGKFHEHRERNALSSFNVSRASYCNERDQPFNPQSVHVMLDDAHSRHLRETM